MGAADAACSWDRSHQYHSHDDATTLREQIEAARVGDPAWDVLDRAAVLHIIDRHRCIPDRDALARAWLAVAMGRDDLEPDHLDYAEADRLIAALERLA